MANIGGNGNRILILDYSTDRSEAELFGQWFPPDCPHDDVYVYSGDPIPEDPSAYTHVMHTGSRLSICSMADFTDEAESFVRRCVDLGIPQLGICYGHQLICRALVGPDAVERSPNGIEIGWKDVIFTGSGLSIPGVEPVTRVLQSHLDRVVVVPDGAEVIASNQHTRIQAFRDSDRKLMGFQFHPEFSREQGNQLFREEMDLLNEHGIDVRRILEDGPSIPTGRVFFTAFLEETWDCPEPAGELQEV